MAYKKMKLNKGGKIKKYKNPIDEAFKKIDKRDGIEKINSKYKYLKKDHDKKYKKAYPDIFEWDGNFVKKPLSEKNKEESRKAYRKVKEVKKGIGVLNEEYLDNKEDLEEKNVIKFNKGGKVKDTELSEHKTKIINNKMRKLSATKGSKYITDIDPRKKPKK